MINLIVFQYGPDTSTHFVKELFNRLRFESDL
jgi:hypothetical protein